MLEWLGQQCELGADSQMRDTSTLTLLETTNADHVELSELFGLGIKFTISELSGTIGITSPEDKPSLSIMYSDTDQPPLVLFRDDQYHSALFTTISGQEYLATTSGGGIRLWNLADNTSRVAYRGKTQNMFFLCVIEERTVACVVEDYSSNGFPRICILKTDAETWNLSSTHLMNVKDVAYDISYAKTTDDTPCCLLIYPISNLVQAVELVGGKVRWQVDKQQMGESFVPSSICTDGSTVFVADLVDQLHLLSVDGSVLTSINLSPFGLRLPSCVCLRGDHLFVGHLNEKEDTYCISKFTKPTDSAELQHHSS